MKWSDYGIAKIIPLPCINVYNKIFDAKNYVVFFVISKKKAKLSLNFSHKSSKFKLSFEIHSSLHNEIKEIYIFSL